MSGYDEHEPAPRVLGAVTVLLTAAAGALNVVTFFSFNQVFASTMSGNLVLIGLAIAQRDPWQALDNVSAIGGYCLGLILGTLLCVRMMRRFPWRNAVGATLTFELLVLVVGGTYLHSRDVHDGGDGFVLANLVLLVVGSGIAMGIQAAAARYIGPAGTPTSFLSGTVTNWVADFADGRTPTVLSWNAPLRILAMVVGAAGNGLVQEWAPGYSYIAPIVLVAVAVLFMVVVVRTNHESLFGGDPQHGDTTAETRPAEIRRPGPVGADPDPTPADERS
ncbi:YoaK family protein [Pseudonocardia phyllosphaerae]|uniref:YoaK family protein n=1 Tax=Pseudonocardia phyllosphaerae TaxID=3390502 RepID=UPI00397AB8F5